MGLTAMIRETERGLLIRNGKASQWLEPGRYHWWSPFAVTEVRRFDLEDGYAMMTPEIKKWMPPQAGEELIVKAEELAILSVDGIARCLLRPGHYVLWQLREKVTAECFDILELFPKIPEKYWDLLPPDLIQMELVYPYQEELLYVDGHLVQSLEEGRYIISKKHRSIRLELVYLREQELQIAGQEVMSKDKVSLRVSLLIKYRIIDVQKSHESVESLYNSIYSEAQMIARRFIALQTIDELLESRQESTTKMRDELQEIADNWGISILQLELKDLILPSDMKILMNRVIEAEKEAAANLILRREETAATRSLANTAKVLEKNPMLMRLKELENLKEVAANIQQLTVVAGAQDILGHILQSTPALDKLPLQK